MTMRNALAVSMWIVSMGFADGARATLMAESSSFGADTVTFDTETGLRWLDLTLSAGLSHTQLQLQLQPGGTFDGYRLATEDEIAELFANAGIDLDPAFAGNFVPENFQPIVDLAALIGQLGSNGNCGEGCTFFFTSGYHAGPPAIPGFLPSASIAWFDNSAGQDPTSPPEPVGRFILEGGAFDTGDPGQGGWLVQVPEPAASLLLGAGHAGTVRAHRRQRRSH
jgi:hypothetical protein